jgi:hypothetical protein
MATFQPIAPNFYTKQLTRNTVTGIQAIQAASDSPNGNAYSARGTNQRPLPGTAGGTSSFGPGKNSITTPNPTVQAIQTVAAVANIVDSAINSKAYANPYGAANYLNPGLYSPSLNRLNNSNLPYGGTYNAGTDGSLPQDNYQALTATPDTVENRVILKDQTGLFIGKGLVFKPLESAGGLLFPYTPTIAVSHTANYELESLLHTNYSIPYYTNSVVNSINIQGKLSAQTEAEGQYVMAAIHFLRTVTKMFYGASTSKGSPPPVLYLDAHGQWMFDHIPVVVKEFQYTLPNDVNYITAKVNGYLTRIPTEMNITIDLIPTYSRNKISNNFDLVKFSNGRLLTISSSEGGWI